MSILKLKQARQFVNMKKTKVMATAENFWPSKVDYEEIESVRGYIFPSFQTA